MKLYTIHDAAETLGIDTQTLQAWLANAHLQAHVDPSHRGEYLLDEGQVEQLAREHNNQLMPPSLNGAGGVQAPTPEIQPVKLGDPVISIGRYPDNTVVLNHPLVSRHHAQLE